MSRLPPRTPWTLALPLGVVGLLAASPALAAESVAVVYHSGDDLDELMLRLAGDRAGTAELLEHNGLDADRLPEPGRVLTVPGEWIQGWTRSHAELLYLRGRVEAFSADGRSLPVGVGLRLAPGDVLTTGPDGAASLRIAGATDPREHDHLQVRAGSRLEIGELFETKAGVRAGLLRLLRGAIEVVTGGSAEVDRRLEVETPTTIGGVRGTAFRVVVEGEAASTRIETLESTVYTAAQGAEVPVGARFGSRVREGSAPEPARPLPDEPALAAPADGAALLDFAFRWQAVPAAASYVVEIALDEEFNRVVVRAPVAEPAWEPAAAGLPEHEGAFHWRVSSVDADGFQGLPSAARRFALP